MPTRIEVCRRPASAQINGEGDCQQPLCDFRSEAGLIGIVMESANPVLGARLEVDHFSDFRLREIATSIRKVCASGRVPAPLTVTSDLLDSGKVQEAGGLAFVSGLADAPPPSEEFDQILDRVSDLAFRRQGLVLASQWADALRDKSRDAKKLTTALGQGMIEAGRPAKSALTVRRPGEILSLPVDPTECIMGDHLMVKGQPLVLAGSGGVGKSRMLLQFAVATITGRDFLGIETHGRKLRWLIIQAENSNRRLRFDLDNLRQWVGTDWQDVEERLSIHTLESAEDSLLSLDSPDAQARLTSIICEHKPDVIAWDSLYNFGIGNLNADEDMRATLLALGRLTREGNTNRALVVLHHATTGRAGAAKATGWDRASFGRNSKVLHSWTRAQINIAPGSGEENVALIVSCGKNSNGKEFPEFAVRLGEDMIYRPDPDFDLEGWKEDTTGERKSAPLMDNDRVAELCGLPMSKAELAKAVMADCGCYRGSAYRYIARATGRTIKLNKANDTYTRK